MKHRDRRLPDFPTERTNQTLRRQMRDDIALGIERNLAALCSLGDGNNLIRRRHRPTCR